MQFCARQACIRPQSLAPQVSRPPFGVAALNFTFRALMAQDV
jgi:hypothetical protein